MISSVLGQLPIQKKAKYMYCIRQTGETDFNLDIVDLFSFLPSKEAISQLQKYLHPDTLQIRQVYPLAYSRIIQVEID